MTTPDTLRALAKRVREEKPSQELEATVARACGHRAQDRGKLGWTVQFNGRGLHHNLPAYTTSLDAAASLMPEGWRLCALLHTECGKWLCSANKPGRARFTTTEAAPTEPQARAAAALLAMAADMEIKP